MALNDTDKRDVERIVKKEIESFLRTTKAHDIVLKIMKDEFGTKKLDDRIVDLSTKVVVELFKTLWQKKSFWENSLKNVK